MKYDYKKKIIKNKSKANLNEIKENKISKKGQSTEQIAHHTSRISINQNEDSQNNKLKIYYLLILFTLYFFLLSFALSINKIDPVNDENSLEYIEIDDSDEYVTKNAQKFELKSTAELHQKNLKDSE